MSDEDALKILVALGDPRRFDIFRKVREEPGLSSPDLLPSSARIEQFHMVLLLRAELRA